MQARFVAYYRVSAQRFGLEGQQKTVQDYINGGDWCLVGELPKSRRGKRSDRPELAKPPGALPQAQG
jgi:hypothetical protein